MRSIKQPPMKPTGDGQKIEVDPAAMLKVWAETADVFKEALDGMDQNSSEMQAVSREMERMLLDNAVTRQVSKNTRWLVLLCCAFTVGLSVWTTSDVRSTARDARDQVMVLVAQQNDVLEKGAVEAREEAKETRRIMETVGDNAERLTQLQAAILGAELAQQEAEQANGVEAVEMKAKAEQRRAKVKQEVEALDGL